MTDTTDPATGSSASPTDVDPLELYARAMELEEEEPTTPQDEAKALLHNIKDLISKGATTGNAVVDFFLANDIRDPELRTEIQLFMDEMRSHEGELVVFIRPPFCASRPATPESALTYLIDSASITLNCWQGAVTAIFTSLGYKFSPGNQPSASIAVTKESHQQLKLFGVADRSPRLQKLQVVIGNDAVSSWLRDQIPSVQLGVWLAIRKLTSADEEPFKTWPGIEAAIYDWQRDLSDAITQALQKIWQLDADHARFFAQPADYIRQALASDDPNNRLAFTVLPNFVGVLLSWPRTRLLDEQLTNLRRLVDRADYIRVEDKSAESPLYRLTQELQDQLLRAQHALADHAPPVE